jgi:hypothetical protein
VASEPRIVSLWRQRDRRDFLCSGLMLGPHHVLTVKHAFLDHHGPIFVRLIERIDGNVEARLVESHSRYDAAILKLPTAVASTWPRLLRSGDRNFDGKRVMLYVMDPVSKSRSTPTSYSIASFDHKTDEFVIIPENPRGHSGGIVEVDGQVIGLLSRRTTGDPLCRAVAMHKLRDWIETIFGRDPDGNSPWPDSEHETGPGTKDGSCAADIDDALRARLAPRCRRCQGR